MSYGLEALKDIYNSLINDIEQEEDEFYNPSDDIKYWKEKYNIVKQDLDRLEKLEKAIEIIKNKGMDCHSISAIKQSKDYEDYLYLVKNLITVVFKLTKQEYELLKEVLCDE